MFTPKLMIETKPLGQKWYNVSITNKSGAVVIAKCISPGIAYMLSKATRDEAQHWADPVFEVICQVNDRGES